MPAFPFQGPCSGTADCTNSNKITQAKYLVWLQLEQDNYVTRLFTIPSAPTLFKQCRKLTAGLSTVRQATTLRSVHSHRASVLLLLQVRHWQDTFQLRIFTNHTLFLAWIQSAVLLQRTQSCCSVVSQQLECVLDVPQASCISLIGAGGCCHNQCVDSVALLANG